MRRALVLLVAISCGRSPPPRPDPTAVAVDVLLRRTTIAALVQLPPERREEEIFGALYNAIDGSKPRPFDQAEYDRRLATRTERAKTDGSWHVRWGAEGTANLDADALRIYFDVVPSHAAVLADFMVAALDRAGVRRYSFKVVAALESFDIPVSAVLYLEDRDEVVGRAAAVEFAADHPEALWPDLPPFALPIARGVAIADEIGEVGPPGIAGNSFGGAMAYVVARALDDAPPELDAAGLATRVRATLRATGFDSARPWLRPSR